MVLTFSSVKCQRARLSIPCCKSTTEESQHLKRTQRTMLQASWNHYILFAINDAPLISTCETTELHYSQLQWLPLLGKGRSVFKCFKNVQDIKVLQR